MQIKQILNIAQIAAVVGAVSLLSACAGSPPQSSAHQDTTIEQGERLNRTEAAKPVELGRTNTSERGSKSHYAFIYPKANYNREKLNNHLTPVDEMFKGKEYTLKGIDTTQSNKDFYFVKNREVKKEESSYILQFATLADFDAAQRRLKYLNQLTGVPLRLIFDAPFYKIRGGVFETKDAAEEKLIELRQLEVSAFVMKK
ncbi:MAG: SPOR domain-containing protein [Fibrobacterales bacterium]